MTSKEIRKKFLVFFEERGHHIVPSAPLVVKNDPTLMFTNAGMNQFKDYFLGNIKSPYPRIANTQKCLRVSGKHNDLEQVGLDTYHHTMFEMLGNWSFADYFKQEAIAWAWELLTKEYGIPPDRLYVTYFQGDREENLLPDEETKKIWENIVDPTRVIAGNKKDNFWEMGETGPCGPCSEIHVDLRSEVERSKLPGHFLVNAGSPEVIELWNLVFIQYHRNASGQLEMLPDRHVDTGMGFERLVRILQNKNSNYETDLFSSLIERLEELTDLKYGKDEKVDIAMRVIADHIRAVSFAIADGQLPSNVKAGYVVRRILRRAVRYGYSFLNLKEPFLTYLYPVLCRIMGEQFPELEQQKSLVVKAIEEEEASFLQTLSHGIKRFEMYVEKNPTKIISGETAFELYDTYGFPLDLTQLMAKERDMTVDVEGFQQLLEQQKQRSRQDAEVHMGDWIELNPPSEIEFVGYDVLEIETKIIKYRKVTHKGKTFYHLVIDRTPFYPEGGGQVGDEGWLIQDQRVIHVTNTIKENELIIHITDNLPESLDGVWLAKVDVERRWDTMRNHSATHLLHWALRKLIGTHVEQKGSLVHPDYLRFDFLHFQKLSPSDIIHIEELINEQIRKNIPLQEYRKIPFSRAMEMQAIALFGEKYSDEVRVIQFDESKELCGGTHVRATGEIGVFKIVEESAIAAGVRRIEAVTGRKALQYFQQLHNKSTELRVFLKGKDPVQVIDELKATILSMEKQIQQFKQKELSHQAKMLLSKTVHKNSYVYLIEKMDLNGNELKDLTYQFKRENLPLMALLYSTQDPEKVHVVLYVDETLAKKYNINASNWIKEIVQPIQGKGGGQTTLAMAAGSKKENLTLMIEKAKTLFESVSK
ncbi:MAG: alanine--tRNA ligase [Bacteroidales bacterium]|nr:alanine--tRNA ligase [Bacteroidales bacterium]